MEKFISDMIIGITSGILTTFLVFFIHKVWISIVRPWYEERVYHDAHFEGTWDAVEIYSDTTPPQTGKFTIEIHRKGHKVTATSTCTDGPDKGTVYIMEGAFKNLILTLTWFPLDSRSLERGTLAMKLTENGRKFVGHGVFYSPATERVHTSSFEAQPHA